MLLQATVLISCMLFLFTTFVILDKPGPGPKDNCEITYPAINGTIHVFNTSSVPKKVCNWYINYNNSKTFDPDHTIFLVFDEVLLAKEDTVTISANGKPLRFFEGSTLSKVSGMFSLLTGQSNITITLDPTNPSDFPFTRIFRAQFFSNSECMYTFDKDKSGIFNSPMYDHSGDIFPIECSFKFAVPDKDNHYMNLWFEPFIFNKGEIVISGALKNDGKYSTTPPVEFLVKDILEVNVTISNQSSTPEVFIVKYDSVTKVAKEDNVCSSAKSASGTTTTSLQSPSKDALRNILASIDKNLNCLWLIDTEEGSTITITVKDNTKLPQKQDGLLILDGPNRSSNVLLDLNFEHMLNERVLYSTGPNLWVAATSPFVSEDFFVDLEVKETKSGGHFTGGGMVLVNGEEATYLLDVKQGQQVKFVLDLKSTNLAQGSSVTFYKDFLKDTDFFMRLEPGHMADVVVSPTEKMAIVTQGFYKSILQGTFLGIDQGCYKYGEGSGDTFSVTGHCNTTCAWIIQPQPTSKDHLEFHFQTMSLSPSDAVMIRKLDAGQTLVANVSFPKSHFPDLWLPAETGVFLQVTRSSCPLDSTLIRSSYQTSSGCGIDLAPGLNENVEISSPGYPSRYPLGANCTWTVLKPSNAAFLHVSFKDLQLAQEKHVLQIFSGTGEKITPVFKSNSSRKELPDDIPVFDSLTVIFMTNIDPPQESLPGFKLEIFVVGSGAVLTSDTGKVETPSFPQPVSSSFFSVWMINAKSTQEQEVILEYKFDNRTDLAALDGLLKVYDGASLHSPIESNLTLNSTVLSRTNHLLLVYQKVDSTQQPGFCLTYRTHECNMSMLCDNGICMHDDWFCNGMNDCGDYSDERNCEGGGWTPRPPTPSPVPKDSVSGASASVLGGSIVAALCIGVLLGVLMPLGYRYWRSRQLFNYSAVNS